MARDDYDDRGRGRDDRYQSSGDERDVGYGDEPLPRRDRMDSAGRGGMGGGMNREGGGRYAGRPEDDARTMRYDREDYEAGGRDRDRGRGGTMGAGMGGNAGWHDTARRDEYGYGARDVGRDVGRDAGRDAGRGEWERDEGRWAREQWERSMHGNPRWDRAYRGEAGDTRDLQRGLQSGGSMGDFSGARDYRSEYGAGYAHEYGREGDYGRRGGGVAGRPGGVDEVRGPGSSAGGNWFAGAHGGAPDRNPGQGFGGLGYSNADDESARGARGREQGGRDYAAGQYGARQYGARDYSGRGPRNYQRSDERIRDDVCERLTRHREIDASDIDIEVRGGVVTLSGHVEDKHAKRLAEDIAEEVMGVTEVRNDLKAARGGLLGALFGHGHADRDADDRHDREVARETARETSREARTGAEATLPSDLGSTGVAATGPSGATGAMGAPGATTATTGTEAARNEARRGRNPDRGA